MMVKNRLRMSAQLARPDPSSRASPLTTASRSMYRVPTFILQAVREAMLDGETHYTSRPGTTGAARADRREPCAAGRPLVRPRDRGDRHGRRARIAVCHAARPSSWCRRRLDRRRRRALRGRCSFMGLTPRPSMTENGSRTRRRTPARLVYRDRGADTADRGA